MRKWLAFAVAAGLAAAVPAVALAGTSGSGSASINCQAVAWRTSSLTTSSGAFSTVPSLTVDVTSISAMTISVSGVVEGAKAAFMLRDVSVAGNLAVPPGIIPFTPGGGTASPFSFTWTDPGTMSAIHGHEIVVQWRRSGPSGGSTLLSADLSITYQTDPSTCPT